MDNTSWTWICLRSRLLKLSRAAVTAVSCHSVSIRGSKSTCIFFFVRQTHKPQNLPAVPSTHSSAWGPVPANKPGGEGFARCRALEHATAGVNVPFALAHDAIDTCDELCILGHPDQGYTLGCPIGSQIANTEGSRAALPLNRLTTAPGKELG